MLGFSVNCDMNKYTCATDYTHEPHEMEELTDNP